MKILVRVRKMVAISATLPGIALKGIIKLMKDTPTIAIQGR